jgi:replicative DNA helicase
MENRLPFNNESERALLNSVLSDPDAAIDILERFTEDDFYTEAHQLIFRAMLELDNSNIAVDFVTLTDMLEKKDHLQKAGGLDYIENLTNALPSTADYKSYMEIVERDSICRRLITASRRIAEEAGSAENAEEVLASAETEIYSISEKKDRSKLSPASNYSNNVLNRINTAITDKDSFKGIPSHFPNLDFKLNGLHPSDLMLVAARPSVGKTAFCMNIVANIITNDPERVVAVFSLEMSAEQLLQRLFATISGTSMKDAQRGDLTPSDLNKIYNANKIINTSKLYIDDSSMINPAQILSKARRLKKREGRLDLLVVDYLQLMVSGKEGKEASRQEVVSDFSRRMKIAAKELNVPLLLISQLSRDIEKRTDKTPQLSDLRESGSIEQDADIVMMLCRASDNDFKDNNNSVPTEDIIKVVINKHRNGELGNLFYKWTGSSLKFESLDDQGKSDQNQSHSSIGRSTLGGGSGLASVTNVLDLKGEDFPVSVDTFSETAATVIDSEQASENEDKEGGDLPF